MSPKFFVHETTARLFRVPIKLYSAGWQMILAGTIFCVLYVLVQRGLKCFSHCKALPRGALQGLGLRVFQRLPGLSKSHGFPLSGS
jgi:hypothetical protein